ncbi:MAG: diguanylate cyclase [Pseudomonadota bacterium]
MRRGDFRIRLLLAVILPSVLMACLLGLFWWNWTAHTLENALRERVEATAKQLATASELPLFSGDVQSLQGMVESIGTGDADLIAVKVADQHGTTIVNHGTADLLGGDLPRSARWSREQNGRYWRLVQPVLSAPLAIDDTATGVPPRAEPLGYVVLDVSLRRLTDMRDNMLLLGGTVIVVAILVSIALMIWLSHGVVQPLTRIIKGVETMGRGDLDTRIEGLGSPVFQPLADVINRMAEGVKLTQAELQHRIDDATKELREAKHKAEQEARMDALTGLYNRRAFLERADEELLRARRYNTPLSLVMVDLDNFKAINDKWGHAIGDQVLIAFADILKGSMREVDIVARIGGEEFVLLMTQTALEEARQAAERIRKDVMASPLQLGDAELHWTASLGVTALTGEDQSVVAALVRADWALYRAKEGGRNRVECETQNTPTPLL